MFPHFLIAGGDGRSRALCELLRQDGCQVATKGLYPHEASGGFAKADVVLLPYPYSQKKGLIPSEYGENIPLQSFLASLKPNAFIFYQGEKPEGGGEGLRFVQYATDEAFLCENTAISAEGALCALMQETEDILCNLRCLITGYGKFAQQIARLMRLHGCRPTVAVRSQEGYKKAVEDGNQGVYINDILQGKAECWDAVLNTVPAMILPREWIMRQQSSCLFFELAPNPGGFDRAAATQMGYRVKTLPGIPGKYAPKAAGRALYNTVQRRMKELSI